MSKQTSPHWHPFWLDMIGMRALEKLYRDDARRAAKQGDVVRAMWCKGYADCLREVTAIGEEAEAASSAAAPPSSTREPSEG